MFIIFLTHYSFMITSSMIAVITGRNIKTSKRTSEPGFVTLMFIAPTYDQVVRNEDRFVRKTQFTTAS